LKDEELKLIRRR